LTPGDYFHQIAESMVWEDFGLLALKTFGFGVIIATVTCYQGLAQPLRLEEVSGATTRAVMQSVVACVLLDSVFVLFYLLI
jgi:phospholipid/cholesterol/gamma-HCH transport system permease protein